ncbi:hypothetical protein C0J52_18077, partial [Blattella germanica]
VLHSTSFFFSGETRENGGSPASSDVFSKKKIDNMKPVIRRLMVWLYQIDCSGRKLTDSG